MLRERLEHDSGCNHRGTCDRASGAGRPAAESAIVLSVNPAQPEPGLIRQAAQVIRRGGLVAFPTETVYGLGANALDPHAVTRIFRAKRRPLHDPLIVHIARQEDLSHVVSTWPDMAAELGHRFWPGPLTLVLPRSPALPRQVTAGLDTVAVRMPSHPVALALIQAAGTPIAAPSANLFGHVSPTTAQHVLDDLGAQVDVVLDGGPTTIGLESTVVDLSVVPPVILRPGGLSQEALRELLPDVVVGGAAHGQDTPLPSPGMLDKHYAPRVQLTVFRGAATAVLGAMREYASRVLADGKKVGLLIATEDKEAFAGHPVLIEDLGCAQDLERIAARLFTAMRRLESEGVDIILTRSFGRTGLGLAIDDRLTKAAGGRVVEVY